jgi:hypothetical protein
VKYKIGTRVYIDGYVVGTVVYLIVDPRSRQVTHLVVAQPEARIYKVVPLEIIAIHSRWGIVLAENTTWDDMPDFDPHHFQGVNDESYVLMPMRYLHPVYYYPAPEKMQDPSNRSDAGQNVSNADVQQGAPVLDRDQRRCGTVIARGENANGELTHMVMSIRTDDGHEAHVPVSWISYTHDGSVHLYVKKALFTG